MMRVMLPPHDLISPQHYGARATIHCDYLTGMDAASSVSGGYHSRDTIFARDDRTVAERPTDIGHDCGSHHKKRCPGRCGNHGDDHIPRAHLRKIIWAAQDTG